jgi:hypothetical protein
MASCAAGERSADCKNGCGCIALADRPTSCACYCFGGATPPKIAVLQGATGPTRKVDVTLRGARASHVAVALSRMLRLCLVVPTSLLDKRLNVQWENVPVRTAIKRLGFVAMGRS